jgi:hypothetical protein
MTNTKHSLQTTSLVTFTVALFLVGCTIDKTELGHLFDFDGGGQQNQDTAVGSDTSRTGTGGLGEGGNAGNSTGGDQAGGIAGSGNGGNGGGRGGDNGGNTGGSGGGTGVVCGTIAGLSCSNGTYCELPPASCSVAGAAGTCISKPQVCNTVSAPVCGCNGKTYGNDCERQSAGVSKAADGACPTGAGGGGGGKDGTGGNSGGVGGGNGGSGGKGGNSDGGAGGTTTGTGGIVGTGGAITSTGGNVGAGGSSGNGGTGGTGGGSGASCGGLVGASCSNGTYCEFPTAACGSNDIPGICTAKPDVCTALAAPVCGCDGKTYSNDCIRQNAGVSKSADGACPSGTGGGGQ